MNSIPKFPYVLFPLLVLLINACGNKKEEYRDVTDKEKQEFVLSTKQIPDNHFLGSESCAECHKNQFDDWKGSHHDKAMELATRETILAPFKGETLKSQGVTSKFFTKNNDFFVNTEGPDGNYYDYKIIYTFGINPLQQYLVKFPDGRYQALRTAWDSEKNKWFDLYPDFKVVHSEWLHWSRGGLNWNNMCADCHSTNVRENYDEKTKSYSTEYSIINVSCEACHGPGKEHVAKVKDLGDAYTSNDGNLQMTSSTDSQLLVDQCARCHMRREQFSENFNYEGTMLDHYFPQLLESPIYYADGQILDEDYVYGSFVQSKMYHNGISCKDCHNSHSLELKFEGNKLCMQCHVPQKYNVEAHHKHKEIGEATQCINCHMVGRIYMGNDYRRDHSFRIPRPDQSIKYGTPNACIQCHTDKTNEWAWQNYKELYGEPDSIHFSDYLAPAIAGEPNAHLGLFKLAQDEKFPDIARASAISAMQNYNIQDHINEFMAFLNDKSPLVRGATVDVLSQSNSTDFMSYLLPLLKDDKRTVRVKAFFALGDVPEANIPENYLIAYNNAKKEFESYLKINADFSGGQAKKAAYYQKKGDLQKVKSAYENALNIDYNNNIVRSNLANVYYNLGETDKAEQAFREVIKQEPDFGLTYYSLGLLLAELNRTEDAISEMEKAHKLMPDNLRVIYNLSLLHKKNKNYKAAENILIKGLSRYPENEELLYALAFHYKDLNKKDKAIAIVNKLIMLAPNNSTYKTLLNSLQGI
ncbi:tetratricopeptide repeat protein [Aureibaculum marinum]|uniref:Tetratricopeptide repeat protein n=1 Tax=Aureibaculum marinum TaxID=2487930 RepID=A0A3N4NSV2_9FLAO|nr:tetratricopeptide repeat protein [Aureibaculum marinum]RPD96156.1 tetratricopeptide repeat protein [Aureibaculum marinum]